MNLQGKVAIVTGGATGIGRAISARLSELGATVVINYRSSAGAAERLVEGLTAKGYKAESFQADVSDFSDAHRLIEETYKKH
ncbi:MAG: SDR family NAD(P)-dependent oxidoreductase, partial [Bacilli bacterium]